MSYYNRRPQILNTLHVMNQSEVVLDISLIIVDDASDEEHRIDDIAGNYKFPIDIIRIEKKDKWWSNPCIPNNMGMKKASGEIIVLQNPEVFYCNDILKDIAYNIKKNDYRAYACYFLGEERTLKLKNTNIFSGKFDYNNIRRYLSPLRNVKVNSRSHKEGWMLHKTINGSTAYNFLIGIYKEDLDHVGYFDERFASGICGEDNEFVRRMAKMGINVHVVPTDNNMYSVHQWHPKFIFNYKDYNVRKKINDDLYNSIVDGVVPMMKGKN